jgi:hypothetical protein
LKITLGRIPLRGNEMALDIHAVGATSC